MQEDYRVCEDFNAAPCSALAEEHAEQLGVCKVNLGVGRSVLEKACREFGLGKWPRHRNRNIGILSEQEMCDLVPQAEDLLVGWEQSKAGLSMWSSDDSSDKDKDDEDHDGKDHEDEDHDENHRHDLDEHSLSP